MRSATALSGIVLFFAFHTALGQQQGPVSPGYGFELPRLSPRPANVNNMVQPVISLNGNWKFTGGDAVNKDIKVPGEWEMQGFHVDSAGVGKYTRNFVIPAGWNGNRIKLRFDGVSSFCKVKINGKEVGQHEGSFVPFEFDVTDRVKQGENQLEVEVQCQTISDILACTSQYAGHPVGGILRKVTLFVLPPVNMADITYTVKFDRDYQNAVLQIPFAVANEGKSGADARVTFELTDERGRIVPLRDTLSSIDNISPGTLSRDTVSLQVQRPEKWNPEHPYLYTLVTKLSVKGKDRQVNRQHIGFRQIEIRGNELFVNGYPVKLHGVCRHSIYPFTGRSVTPALCWEDAELFRDGNCNYIRTSHYPPSEEFLDACDSLGLFVESESSLCWIDHGASPIWKKWNYTDPKFLPYMVNANTEKMIADRNHPSVIIWSLGNESRWSPLWVKVNEVVKQLDPSRPTAFQDQCWGGYNDAGSKCDIANYHYPGLNGPAACDTMHRPTMFDEYLHVENYNRREVLTDPFIRADWGGPLREMYDSMYLHKGNLGGAIWAGIDDIFHLPDGRIIGYGPWGVIDGWRRKKPEYFEMKKSYAPVVIKNAAHPGYENGKMILRVEDRYDFTDLAALKITYKTGHHSGIVKADIRPHGEGNIEIPVSEAELQNNPLLITFTDPRGFICQQELIPAGKVKNKMPASVGGNKKIQLTESADSYLIKNGNTTFRISKSDGWIEKAALNGINVIEGAPALMIVPLNDDDGNGKGMAGCNYQRNIKPLLYQGCESREVASVKAMKESDGSVSIVTEESYKEAKGTQVMRFSRDGIITIDYAFTVRDTIRINPRQWGISFTLPASYQTLSWRRKGRWSIYPGTDIARETGTTVASPVHQPYVEAWGKPAGDWKNDANELGTRDFRSTKANVYFAQLTDKSGVGIRVLSDGTQSARSWIDGKKVIFLIAQYNTGGDEGFSAGFYSKERRPLKGGDLLKGEVKFRLVE